MPVNSTLRAPDDPCGPQKLLAPIRSVRLRTAIPGPGSLALFERRAAVSSSTPHFPVAVAKAHGALIYDVDGNVLIDFMTGTESALGHTPDALMEVLRSQVEVALYGDTVSVHVALCERLNQITPGGPYQTVLFATADDAMHAASSVKNAILADERYRGLGRTGQLFAFEGNTIPPDLVVHSRALASGLPLGAVTGKPALIAQLQATLPNPVSVVAAMRTLDTVIGETLSRRALQLETLFRERVAEWGVPESAVQGQGLDLRFCMPYTAVLSANALRHGLLIAATDDALLITPPLMVPEEQWNEALDILEQVIQAEEGVCES